jgi:hypothetical protein
VVAGVRAGVVLAEPAPKHGVFFGGPARTSARGGAEPEDVLASLRRHVGPSAGLGDEERGVLRGGLEEATERRQEVRSVDLEAEEAEVLSVVEHALIAFCEALVAWQRVSVEGRRLDVAAEEAIAFERVLVDGRSDRAKVPFERAER